MSVSGDWRSDAHVNFSEGTVRIPEPVDDPDLSRTAKIIEQTGPQNIAAVIIETVSGVNGVVIPPQSWLDKIQNLCADNNIYYIADEVLCGFGRSGKNFAFQNFNLKPDLVCMSKGITGGYIPFGAVWVSNDIAKYYDQNVLACGLTSYAHPLGLAALDAVSEILNDVEFKTSLQQLQQTFADSIDRLARQHSATAYRRQGLLAAIEFGDRTLPPWTHFIEHGLLVFSKANMLILAPPLVTKPARLQQAFDQLGQSLTQ
jgi:taurine--2-oxoglutarate transaminase